MQPFILLTNNPRVFARYPSVAVLNEGGVEAVLLAARDQIHQGAKLINHPQSGSIRLPVNPYRSLVLTTDRGAVDRLSLQLIEDALTAMRGRKAGIDYAAEILLDFQVIDLDLADSAMVKAI